MASGRPRKSQRAHREAIRRLTHAHTEFLAYAEWEGIARGLSELGLAEGDPIYDEYYAIWRSWQQKQDEDR